MNIYNNNHIYSYINKVLNPKNVYDQNTVIQKGSKFYKYNIELIFNNDNYKSFNYVFIDKLYKIFNESRYKYELLIKCKEL